MAISARLPGVDSMMLFSLQFVGCSLWSGFQIEERIDGSNGGVNGVSCAESRQSVSDSLAVTSGTHTNFDPAQPGVHTVPVRRPGLAWSDHGSATHCRSKFDPGSNEP